MTLFTAQSSRGAIFIWRQSEGETVSVTGTAAPRPKWQSRARGVRAFVYAKARGADAVSLDIAQTAAVTLSGSASVSGDIEPLAGTLDVAQTSAVALSGDVSVSGDIEIGTSFDLAQTANVALSGAATVSGDVQIGVGLDLAQTNVVALAGSVAVSGDVQSSTEAVVIPQTGGGRARRVRRPLVVEIDGEDFIVGSEEEAVELLDKAKAAAEEKAELAVSRAAVAKRRKTGQIMRDARKSLEVPTIKAPGLDGYAARIIDQIRDTYESAFRSIEVAALLHKRDRDEEDDEEILMLIA